LIPLGGAKRYTKGEGFTSLRGFKSLRLLLTNTKVPRSTAVLVAGVGDKCRNYPNVMNPIMDAVQAISDDCTKLFENHADGVITKEQVVARIEVSMDCVVDLQCSYNMEKQVLKRSILPGSVRIEPLFTFSHGRQPSQPRASQKYNSSTWPKNQINWSWRRWLCCYSYS
jgi:hypothetical protein